MDGKRKDKKRKKAAEKKHLITYENISCGASARKNWRTQV